MGPSVKDIQVLASHPLTNNLEWYIHGDWLSLSDSGNTLLLNQN
jgi:hypothetical protein